MLKGPEKTPVTGELEKRIACHQYNFDWVIQRSDSGINSSTLELSDDEFYY